MEQLAAQISEQLGYPSGLVIRSAEARAQVDGVSAEAVLTAWAGGGEVAAAPAAAASPTPAAAPTAPAAPEPGPEVATGPAVEVLSTAEPEVGGEPVEPPSDIEPEPDEEHAVAGIPGWLVAAFIVVPLVALIYGLFLPNGPECGEGAVLAVDPVSGEAVNCDGSEFGLDEVDFFSVGRSVYGGCIACHGANGQGGGNFPAFAGGAVLETFPVGQCVDHVEWVRVGTEGWTEPTYGATANPVGGSGAVMPGFGNALDEEELRAVVLYERVAFGGQELIDAEADCRLGEGESVAADE